MLKDITLGQFFPGDSPVHRLDPRTKLLLTLDYIVCLFVASGWVSYPLMMAALGAGLALSRLKPAAAFKGLKPLVVIILVTAVLNLFYSQGEPLVKLWIFTVTREGIRGAVLMALRIVMMVMGTFLLTYTTAPMALSDGIEQMFSRIACLRQPVHTLAMMGNIALSYIPAFIEETDKVMSAQKARGADFETGSLIRRAKALVPLLVPLFISAFRRADDLAVAMESRCYHGGEGRTRMKQLHMAARDWTALALGTVLLTAILLLRRWGL